MEDLDKTQIMSLPNLQTKPKTAGKKRTKTVRDRTHVRENPAEYSLNTVTSPSEKRKLKDVSAAHPAMIGVDIQSMHPFHSELVDGLYKRPLVVSILIPKKRAKSFKYETSRKIMLMPSDLFSSGAEDSEGGSSKRLSPDRPSSRKANSTDGSQRKVLKIFIIKVYDLVESKEAVYPVVVRDFDKLLEEMIDEEKTFALCDYFKPQLLDWWAKSLRNILIVFDRPNSELSVVVDKKLIRRMVAEKMKHHDWMDQALSPEQLNIRNKMLIDKVRKKGSSSKKMLRSSQDLGSSAELVPWNDYVASMGERNAGSSFRGPHCAGSSSKVKSSSIKALPPVRSINASPPRAFVVGEWVQGNFKRAGQWYPGIIKKVHKDDEYYDIDYDDGRSEMRVEAKLIRPSATEQTRDRLEYDVLDLTDYNNANYDQDNHNAVAEPCAHSSGDISALFECPPVIIDDYSQKTPNRGGKSLPPSTEVYTNSSTTSSADELFLGNKGQSSEAFHECTFIESKTKDYIIGEANHDNQAYDYTNQAFIEDYANTNFLTTKRCQEEESPEEVVEEVKIEEERVEVFLAQIKADNSDMVREVVTPYVNELISGVLISQYPTSFDGEGFEENNAQKPTYELKYTNTALVDERVETKHCEEEVTPVFEPTEYERNECAVLAGERAAADAVPDHDDSSIGFHIGAGGEGVFPVFDAVEELAGDSLLEESNYSTYNQHGDVGSPSKIALASMMRSLSLEESSIESDEPSKSKSKSRKKTARTKKNKKNSCTDSSTKGLALNSSSILLGNSVFEQSRTSTATAAENKKFARVKSGDPGSPQAPEGLFKSSVRDRAKTASSLQPPSVEKYVAAAVSTVKTDSRAATTNGKKARGASGKKTSLKKKKKKQKEDPSTQQLVDHSRNYEGGDHSAIAKEILKDVPYGDGDDQSVHSLRSLQSLHSNSSHHTVHFTADSHGNFDHSHIPHYPLPHVSRTDATKAALEAIHKPHSNPHDRYTYLMMPAPLHMNHVDQHHYGYGPKHHLNHHGHHGHSTPHSELSRSQDSADHGHHHPSHHVELPGPHSVDYVRALSPDSLRKHNENHAYPHGDHHGHHHGNGKSLHFPHHDHDFIVSTSLEESSHTHSREPSIFSETMRSTIHNGSHHDPAHISHRPVHGNSPSQISFSSSASGPLTLPNIHNSSSGSRPTSAGNNTNSIDLNNAKNNSQVVVHVDTHETDRPGSKIKRSTNPFAHKEKYKGPERRVIDILEWARISVGGSPKRQTRKISNVERRLLKRYVNVI